MSETDGVLWECGHCGQLGGKIGHKSCACGSRQNYLVEFVLRHYEAERREFEEYAATTMLAVSREDGCEYELHETQCAWDAWRAARRWNNWPVGAGVGQPGGGEMTTSTMKAIHEITACYYPNRGEVYLTWKNLGDGKQASLTAKVSEEDGASIARVVMPCVFSGAAVSAGAPVADNDAEVTRLLSDNRRMEAEVKALRAITNTLP